jgi:hypothetical protein
MEVRREEEEVQTLVLSGHDLVRLERGESIRIHGVEVWVDHSSVQDYPMLNHLRQP